MRLRIAAVAIVAVSIAVFVVLQTRRTGASALGDAAERIAPSALYYRIEQNGTYIGVAVAAIDTTRTAIIERESVNAAMPVGDDVLRMRASAIAHYTRALDLREFVLSAEGDLTPFVLHGTVSGPGERRQLRLVDSTRGAPPRTTSIPLEQPLLLPVMAPVALMLSRGKTLRATLFDPLMRIPRTVTLSRSADSVFVLPRGARYDATAGRWLPARMDTLRGHRLGGETSPLTAWVDTAGRLIAASEPGGITVARTARELATRR